MSEFRKHQVSLRGASAKEITRDALLERVNQERELRNYARRANSAVLLIQRVWRRHHAMKTVAQQMQLEWESMIGASGDLTKMQMHSEILRPFLFFVDYLCVRRGSIGARDRDCMISCFKTVLENINSNDASRNFCTMAIGSSEERRIWLHQSKKLLSVCLFILSLFDFSEKKVPDVILTSLAMRLAVLLTEPKGWSCIAEDARKDANDSVRNLVEFLGSYRSGLYSCVRKFICKLKVPFSSSEEFSGPTDDRFLIIASAITLSLRPFHVRNMDVDDNGLMECVVEQYWVSLLTIPWFPQRLPSILVPALRHQSVLSPCLMMLMISNEKFLKKFSEMDQLDMTSNSKVMPRVGWALANTMYLAIASETSYSSALKSGKFAAGLDCKSYLRVVVLLADSLLSSLNKYSKPLYYETRDDNDSSSDPAFNMDDIACGLSQLSYMDLFRHVYQPWHLDALLALENLPSVDGSDKLKSSNSDYTQKSELFDVAYYYSSMLRLFSTLNPVLKALPVLNMLSFKPGFLLSLWGQLEKLLFPGSTHFASLKSPYASRTIDQSDGHSDRKDRKFGRDTGNRWVNVLHKITGKSQSEYDSLDSVNEDPNLNLIEEQPSNEWDIELLRQGPEGISSDISCLLHLFCSSYSHLLLVLDDIEFYDKQVPFTLEQQRKVAASMNTLVYSSLSRSLSPQCQPLVKSAVQCLHLLYERDCRHQFCPPALWLSPGKNNRLPIAVAARTHDVFSVTDGGPPTSSLGSVITTMPHVFPFEERVEMFREFISMDKVSRRMAGEVTAPGSRAIEIVIRRGHVPEDGFRQLNSLGSRLKSAIHVSFVSESGLPEAGLDYGGLTKEFLTDISKAAFSPEYGLFSQTSTSDRHLIPNTTARYLDNGIQMIEFLGRIVGKALYEGILLDFYFSHVFVQKLLGRYSFLDELSTLDPELYRNLIYVKNYEGDASELCLDFTVTEESFGKRNVVELKPGGKDIGVTNENKLQYVHAMADYKLNRQILPFSNAFYRGLSDLLSPSWLKLFNAAEFNQLLSGGKHDIDVNDLRQNTLYTGGYSDGSRTVKLFWEVFAGFEPRERCMLLKFVTSCSRAPLLGFKHLQPAFTIHKVACDVPLWATFGGQDVDRLPSASTCYNTLKLPTYKRASTLKAKLLYAINSNAGFELS